MKNYFNLSDFEDSDFFRFGRSALHKGELKLLEHAMYDLYSPIDKKILAYNLMTQESKPTFIRPGFLRSCNLLSTEQKQFILSKFNFFLSHLESSEGLDFFNAFLVVSPNSVLEHIHTGVVFEQTYVFTQNFEAMNTQFHIGDSQRAKGGSFDFIEEDYFVRLYGEPVPHHVISNDKNLKFYFVFEYSRQPKTDHPFNCPIRLPYYTRE